MVFQVLELKSLLESKGTLDYTRAPRQQMALILGGGKGLEMELTMTSGFPTMKDISSCEQGCFGFQDAVGSMPTTVPMKQPDSFYVAETDSNHKTL